VDLTEFTGKSQVRIAFVVTNSNGNNLYLDSVEFFISKDQRLIDVETSYSVFGYVPDDFGSSTFKVGFNLEQRQPVACEVVDPMGKLVGRAQWSEVLNQIFDLPLPPDAASGLYIVRVNIGGAYSFQRIFKP
jgi:hypothetical protein